MKHSVTALADVASPTLSETRRAGSVSQPAPIYEELQISLYHVARSPYRSLTLRDNTHPCWALSYVASGAVETECRGELSLVQAGDLMVHPPEMAYSEIAREPGTHEWLLLKATLPPGLDLLRLHPVPPVVRLAPTGDYSALFDRLLALWHRAEAPYRSLQLAALTTQILGLVLTSWEAAGSPPRPAALLAPEDRLGSLIAYMADHLSAKISRDDLAGQACLHPVYFDRLFRETYQLSPMRMLRRMRLRRAEQLLASSDLTLDAIADACGLGCASHLIRLFQRQFGQTPGSYRESLKQSIKSYDHALS